MMAAGHGAQRAVDDPCNTTPPCRAGVQHRGQARGPRELQRGRAHARSVGDVPARVRGVHQRRAVTVRHVLVSRLRGRRGVAFISSLPSLFTTPHPPSQPHILTPSTHSHTHSPDFPMHRYNSINGGAWGVQLAPARPPCRLAACAAASRFAGGYAARPPRDSHRSLCACHRPYAACSPDVREQGTAHHRAARHVELQRGESHSRRRRGVRPRRGARRRGAATSTVAVRVRPRLSLPHAGCPCPAPAVRRVGLRRVGQLAADAPLRVD